MTMVVWPPSLSLMQKSGTVRNTASSIIVRKPSSSSSSSSSSIDRWICCVSKPSVMRFLGTHSMASPSV